MFYRFSLEPRLPRAGAGAVEGACKGAGFVGAKQAFKSIEGRNQEALATMVAQVKDIEKPSARRGTASSRRRTSPERLRGCGRWGRSGATPSATARARASRETEPVPHAGRRGAAVANFHPRGHYPGEGKAQEEVPQGCRPPEVQAKAHEGRGLKVCRSILIRRKSYRRIRHDNRPPRAVSRHVSSSSTSISSASSRWIPPFVIRASRSSSSTAALTNDWYALAFLLW